MTAGGNGWECSSDFSVRPLGFRLYSFRCSSPGLLSRLLPLSLSLSLSPFPSPILSYIHPVFVRVVCDPYLNWIPDILAEAAGSLVFLLGFYSFSYSSSIRAHGLECPRPLVPHTSVNWGKTALDVTKQNKKKCSNSSSQLFIGSGLVNWINRLQHPAW